MRHVKISFKHISHKLNVAKYIMFMRKQVSKAQHCD